MSLRARWYTLRVGDVPAGGDVAVGEVMSLYERGGTRYRVGNVPAGGDGCYAAVTSAKPTQPAEGAQPLATARHNLAKRHNLGKADTTLNFKH